MATELAIGNHVDRSRAALGDLKPAIDFSDEEMAARYYLAEAVTLLKERRIDEALATFKRSLSFARSCGDVALIAGVLTNYGTAAAQDGSLHVAIACLEERQRLQGTGERSFIGLQSLAEALFLAGFFERAAELLHRLYDNYAGSVTLIGAATSGIPLGILLQDRALLAKSNDPALLDLAFSRGEQWLIGPLAESFCMLYEHEGLRAEHDELLRCAIERSDTLDNSLPLAVRAARIGDVRALPRIAKIVANDYSAGSPLQAARLHWFEAVMASRHARRSASRKLALRAAEGFAQSERPLSQAAALISAGCPDEGHAVLKVCGAAATPAVRWKAPAIRRRASELTAREVEVARLAASGLPNRAIAEALDVSERTVHRHCESIFSKLGIHSRWQLSETSWGGSKRG